MVHTADVIDECSATPGPCGANSACSNAVAGFTCACTMGWKSPAGNGSECTREPSLVALLATHAYIGDDMVASLMVLL